MENKEDGFSIPFDLFKNAQETNDAQLLFVYVSLLLFQKKENISLRRIAEKTKIPFSTFLKKCKKLEENGFCKRENKIFFIENKKNTNIAQESPKNHPRINNESKETVITTTQNQSTNIVQESPKNHPRIKKTSQEHVDLAGFLGRGIAHTNPAFTQKNTPEKLQKTIKKWAEDIEKLCRIDNATPQQIIDVVTWLYSGKTKNSIFWQSNILSAKKLREKWETLVARRISDGFESIKEDKGTLSI